MPMLRPLLVRRPTIPPGAGVPSRTESFERGRLIRFRRFWHENGLCSLVVHITSSRPISEGAFGAVYKGEATRSGRTFAVALKVISQTVEPVQLELISRELRAMETVLGKNGPHILRYLGEVSEGAYTIIATEYMPNGTMSEYLKRTSGAEHQRLILQVAEGLSWLHESVGIVHGDIKGQNVLINAEHEAVIADFGLATLVVQDPLGATTAADIRQKYTPAFAAPELLDLEDPPETSPKVRVRSKTVKSDVYAFGMLVLEAFTGALPWPKLGLSGIIVRIVERTPHPRPSDEQVIIRGLTNSWWAVCLKCWAWEPADRPDMRKIWDELEAS
ncbi:kinase-like protein [Auricularia subglabra TFB-10046 SS5]|nr:kinase-like protein [Auricularia subglabra TFB-10046 SS5]